MSTGRIKADNAAGDDVEVDLHPALEGDGYWKSKGRQWLLMCPHMSSTAKIGHSVLCSLVSDRTVVRRFTAAEFAALITKGAVDVGAEPKTMSASGAIAVLRDLAKLGQITKPDGSPVTFSSRGDAAVSVRIWSYPRHECGCHRNVHDALATLRGKEPYFPLATVGQKAGAPANPPAPDQDEEGGTAQPGDNTDAPQPPRKRSPAAAVEAELLEARAKAKEREDAKAAEHEQTGPGLFPPVEYRPGTGWTRQDAPPTPEPEKPKPTKPKRPARVEIPDDFRMTDAMHRWAAAQFPQLDLYFQTEQFASHHRSRATRSANWSEEWRKWIRNADEFRARDARRTGPKQRPAPQMPDGTPMTYADGTPLIGADLKFAQGMAVAARMKAREEHGTSFLDTNPFFTPATPTLPSTGQE